MVIEAEALRYAMFITKDLGLKQVVFEGDGQQVVKDVNSLQETATIESPIIFDIKNLMFQNLDWTMMFINHEVHMAAHYLSKIALSCNGGSVWMKDCPT